MYMNYAGLDIHKNFCQTVICTQNGEIIKEEKIQSNIDSISEFFSNFEKLNIAMEASTNYEYIYDTLENIGHNVFLAHPLKTRLIAESKIKTDKIDAKILAHLLRTNMLPTSYVPPANIRSLRSSVRRRIYLGKMIRQLKNRIHAELLKRGLSYQNEIFTKNGIKWLESLQIDSINSYLIMFNTIKNESDKLEKSIKYEALKYNQIKLLIDIVGIAPYSAAIIYSEIGDINRFPSENKLFSYAGLVPSVHQSGNNIYYGKITKQGSKYLRWILVEVIRIHLRFDPDSKLSKYYQKLSKRKPKNIAIIATSKKLLQIIYHMLKNNERYQG